MSIYAQINEDGDQFQFASNLGWEEFGRWIESLDHKKFPRPVEFYEHAITESPGELAEQLESALSENAPGEDVEKSARDLIAAAKHAGPDDVLLLTNGVSA